MSERDISELIDIFGQYFPGNNDQVQVYFAPGRVNLIGEHTDYNGGYVLPAALTYGTYMVIRPRTDRRFNIASENFRGETVAFNSDELSYKKGDSWGNYPKGVVKELKETGVELSGADILYYGNIPNGAGLSSSASIGMVTAFGLDRLAGGSLSRQELAFLCQRVENRFIGVNTGIMDQFAVGLGERDHALFLNCETLDYHPVPLELGDYRLVITNSNKQRGLADSKYNERRSECEEGFRLLKTWQPEAGSLSDITNETFQQHASELPLIIRKRVAHVLSENRRVKQAVSELNNHNLEAFGRLMIDSHESLRGQYEVTGSELDALFNAQKSAPGCIGTRMTGAGFGGCTISIVHKNALEDFQTEVSSLYNKETELEAEFYICTAGDGVKELEGVKPK